MKVALKVKYICEGQPLVAWWCVCFDVLRSVLWKKLSWRSFRSKVPLSENTHLHPQSRIQINSHSFYSARSKKAKWQEMARDGKLWRSLRARLCSLSSGNHFSAFSTNHQCLISNLSIVGTWCILVQWRLYLDVWPVCARCSEKSWTGANVLTRSPHLKFFYLDVWPVCSRCSQKSWTGANILTRSPHLKLSWGEGPEIEPTLENENGTLYIKYCIFFTFQHS